jgi:flagellar hook protein FlgE
MDVTANNISNVNTVAFKAGRATFKESMVQMLQGPSRPAGNQGGRNPMQVGLGVAVGSIDTMLRQGNLQTTGQITDIALEGRAYFAFSNGSGTFYSRNGGLQMDDMGRLVSPTNGFRLQGKMAQPDGTFTGKEMISDIRIPWGEKSPAKATENMTFGCNLNSDSEALGTVTHTNRFLASAGVMALSPDNILGGPTPAVGTPEFDAWNTAMRDYDAVIRGRGRLTDLYDEYGKSLGIKEGDTLSFGVADKDIPSFRFVVEKQDVKLWQLDPVSGNGGWITPLTDPATNKPMQEVPTIEDFRRQLEAYLNAIKDPTVCGEGISSTDRNKALKAYMDTYLSLAGPSPTPAPGTPGGPAMPAGMSAHGVTVNLDGNGRISVTNLAVVAVADDPNDPATDYHWESDPINGLQVSSSRPGSKAYVANAFLFPPTIKATLLDEIENPPGSGTMVARPKPSTPPSPTDPVPPIGYFAGQTKNTPPLRIPASGDNTVKTTTMNRVPDPANPGSFITVLETSTLPSILMEMWNDKLGGLYDADGRPLGFTEGDVINMNGQVGGRNYNSKEEPLIFDGSDDVPPDPITGLVPPTNNGKPATRMSDLITFLQNTLKLPSTDGTVYNRPSVTIKSSHDGVSDGIPPGSIVLRGQQEVAFALTGLSTIAKQADPNQPDNPTRFNTNMVFQQVQAARNTGEHSTAHVVYDESGAEHQVIMTFTHTGTPGEWLWELTLGGGEEVILGGNRGRLTFALDGSPSSFTFDDGTNQFRFDPRNGANEVDIKMDIGGPGSFLGITQFESETTTAIKAQDGYPMGKLTEITIGESGEISGLYSNGISKAIAMIYVAEFNNPAGLMKMGDSMFGVSNNSGEAAMYQPGVGSTTKVKPGAIEMSNVELETEFTNMITLQRGYQASARVITTSDQMLQELVQLVR